MKSLGILYIAQMFGLQLQFISCLYNGVNCLIQLELWVPLNMMFITKCSVLGL